jgi:outer membrane receptor for ferrienterochelin and colicins
MKPALLLLLGLLSLTAQSQPTGAAIIGTVTDAESGEPLVNATIRLHNTRSGTVSDADGRYTLPLPPGIRYPIVVHVTYVGYVEETRRLDAPPAGLDIALRPESARLNEVVISGTMVEMGKLESPIPVEVYSRAFLTRNPTPSLFESMGMITGVIPQINCNVCNTGDIHINGLEGPYTMILIDGMPIVSSLSTVYGLHGIPTSLIRRIEVVKGPASTLYGSEAVAGVINVITQDPYTTDRLHVDVSTTGFREHLLDVSAGQRIGGAATIWGVNGFLYDTPHDVNGDGFTDVTQQKRLSLFTKWAFGDASIAARGVVENRWGGQLDWTPADRGSDLVYGESIRTERVELIGSLPLVTGRNESRIDASWNTHKQDSWYGTTVYKALQHTGYAVWLNTLRHGRHTTVAGLPLRWQHYDDNTPATVRPDVAAIPGVFAQSEWTVTPKTTVLTGLRFDLHPEHGGIWTPRIGFKTSPDADNTFRLTAGSGFRVVNLFTEDHAALTGARDVLILNDLRPEESWNVNANWMRMWNADRHFGSLDLSVFLTRFSNQIVPDYDTDPTKIIYDNLDGYGISRGMGGNVVVQLIGGPRFTGGVTWMNVFRRTDRREAQLFAPEWSGTYGMSWKGVDVTGTVTGPMSLPTVPGDFRPAKSPWMTHLNIQGTRRFGAGWEWYGGVKNLLDVFPKNPLFRPDAPFSDEFDASYNYAQLQGRKAFMGVRLRL